MPEFLRAYIVVIALSIFMFSLLLRLDIDFIKKSELKIWRNYWLMVTTLCFFVGNIWVYIASLSVAIFYAKNSEQDRLPLFFAISCAAPLYSFTIPGFGLINYLITLNYASVLCLLILWPEAQKSKQLSKSNYPFYSAVVIYFLVISLLDSRENSFTNSLRLFTTYLLAIFLPFMAISKAVTNVETLKKCLFTLTLCLAPLALVGCFESIKYWKLYSPAIANMLGADSALRYGIRGDSLRASALFSSPIVFGYIMVMGIALTIFCRNYTSQKKLCNLVFCIFLVALYFTKARGPWIGFMVMMILHIWSGPDRFGNFTKFSLGSALTILALSTTSFGEKLISMLPFISSSDSHEASTVDYRIRLLEQAGILFRENTLFGLVNYRETPEMEVMRQGQGIIDVVNSYVHIALNYGLIGLGLFLFIFLGLFLCLLKTLRKLPPEQKDLINIGRALYAILGAMLFIIFTVSSINYIPIFYWLLAGLSSAYIRLCRTTLIEQEVPINLRN